jgi:hypothetical protein
MTVLSKFARNIVYSALLNCAILLVFLIFLVSTRWDALLDKTIVSGPFLTLSFISEQYLPELLTRMVVGTLTVAILLFGFVGKRNSPMLVLSVLCVSCIGVSALFLFSFEGEFQSGYIFRRPSGNLGFLYPPAIYTSLIIVVGVFVAMMSIARTALRIFMEGKNHG